MSTVADLKKRLESYPEDMVVATAIWSAEDVFMRVAEYYFSCFNEEEAYDKARKVISQEEAENVIEEMDDGCDSDYGLNWTYMDGVLGEVVPDLGERVDLLEQSLSIIEETAEKKAVTAL